MPFRQPPQDVPVVVFAWGPVPLPSGFVPDSAQPLHDKVDCEPVLMARLPWSRFRGPFGEQVRLPVGTAEALERFEAELRVVGLIGPDEVLRQSAKLPTHFRVQVRNRKYAAIDIHEASSILTPIIGAGANPAERSTTLGRREVGFASKLVTSLEQDAKRPKVHDKRPKARRDAPT